MADARIAAKEKRLVELKKMSDDDLRERFWELCHKAVAPMIDLAKTHTSPSIERSVLMRMGIDSITAKGVVERCAEAGLLPKGAGHVVLKVSEKQGVDIRKAAEKIAASKDVLQGLF